MADNMTEQEIIKKCYGVLNQFVDVYPKDSNWENKMPDNVKLTVFCKSSKEEGFLFNTTSDEMGLTALIVVKWIAHSELEKLLNIKIGI